MKINLLIGGLSSGLLAIMLAAPVHAAQCFDATDIGNVCVEWKAGESFRYSDGKDYKMPKVTVDGKALAMTWEGTYYSVDGKTQADYYYVLKYKSEPVTSSKTVNYTWGGKQYTVEQKYETTYTVATSPKKDVRYDLAYVMLGTSKIQIGQGWGGAEIRTEVYDGTGQWMISQNPPRFMAGKTLSCASTDGKKKIETKWDSVGNISMRTISNGTDSGWTPYKITSIISDGGKDYRFAVNSNVAFAGISINKEVTSLCQAATF